MMTTETDQFYMCRGAPVPLHANFCAIGIRRELETSPAVRKCKREYSSFKRTRSFTTTNNHKEKK